MIVRNVVCVLSVFVLSGCCLGPLVGLDPEIKITAKVTDVETGKPIEGADVGFNTMYLEYKPGYNNGFAYEKSRCDRGVSDQNGICTMSGRSMRGAGMVANIPLKYYLSNVWHFGYGALVPGSKPKENQFYVNRVKNIWEPWNPTFELKLRPIRNPQPMLEPNCTGKDFEFPSNVPIAFDFLMQRPLPPYGIGKVSDMTITILESQAKDGWNDYSYRYAIEFANEGDGVIPYFTPPEYKESKFRYPYEAPADGYQRKIEFKFERTPSSGGPSMTLYLPHDVNWKPFTVTRGPSDHHKSMANQEYIFKLTRKNVESEKAEEYYGITQGFYLQMFPDEKDATKMMEQGRYTENSLFANPFNRGLEYNRMNLWDYSGLQDAIFFELAKTSKDEKFVNAMKEYYQFRYADNWRYKYNRGLSEEEWQEKKELRSAADHVIGIFWDNMILYAFRIDFL